MRVFVAGASGALGSRLVPQLIDAGHEVIGTHHRETSAALLRRLGATPVRLDLLDAAAVREAVLVSKPEALIHQATALGEAKWGRNFDKTFAGTNALRTKGTDALLAAAWEVGAERFVAQSFASYRYEREGSSVKNENDKLDSRWPANARESFAAMAHLDQAVADFGGIVLRYGAFYGAANDGLIEPVRKRQIPIIGDGGGLASWIHLDDAAAATVLALEHDGPAIYNIVDDEPAAVRDWLPVLAEALQAGPPRHFPTWLARIVAGEAAVVMGTETRGASNAKAKRELGWTPTRPSWRTGFFETYAAMKVADRPQPEVSTRAPRHLARSGVIPEHRPRRRPSPRTGMNPDRASFVPAMEEERSGWLELGMTAGYAYATKRGEADRLRLGRIARAHSPADVKANVAQHEITQMDTTRPTSFWSGFAHGVGRYLFEQAQLPTEAPLER